MKTIFFKIVASIGYFALLFAIFDFIDTLAQASFDFSKLGGKSTVVEVFVYNFALITPLDWTIPILFGVAVYRGIEVRNCARFFFSSVLVYLLAMLIIAGSSVTRLNLCSIIFERPVELGRYFCNGCLLIAAFTASLWRFQEKRYSEGKTVCKEEVSQ